MKVLQFPKQRRRHEIVEHKEPFLDIGEFWRTLKQYAKKMGVKVVSMALTLYFVFKEKSTPLWAKALIAGALAYLILPLDMIPDFLPGGWIDDAAAMTTALYAVKMYVTEVISKKVERIAGRYFCYGEGM